MHGASVVAVILVMTRYRDRNHGMQHLSRVVAKRMNTWTQIRQAPQYRFSHLVTGAYRRRSLPANSPNRVPLYTGMLARGIQSNRRNKGAPTGDPSDAQAPRVSDDEEKPRYTPWITFDPDQHPNLEQFLSSWPPSSTWKSQCAWIHVLNPHPKPAQSEPRPQPAESTDSANGADWGDESSIGEAWSDICDRGDPTIADLENLARRFNIMCGKWLIFAETTAVDEVWSCIAKATHSGMLGDAAKVSSRSETGRHVICVFTRDFTDESDVRAVREGLRRLGVAEFISYKPDIYTNCGVYKDNLWGISPSRYRL